MTQMGDSIRRRRRGARRGRERSERVEDGARAGRPRLDLLRWIPAGLAVVALAFLIGWLVATQILFPKPALAGNEVEVPDLAGMTLERAREELAGLQLEVGPVREMVHPTARRGVVIAQDPVVGMRLRPGAQVRFAVSRGRARATVPDLVGMPADAAIELARRVGFQPERLEEPTIEPAGTVLRTRPVGGEQLEVPARITIVVSAGGLAPPEPEPVAPDSEFTGMDMGTTGAAGGFDNRNSDD